MRKAVWLMAAFLGLMCVAIWRGAESTRSTLWERYMAAGDRLQAHGRPADAAKRYQAAIRRAERFGPADPRLAISLGRYATLLRATGQAEAAAPLEARAQAIRAQIGEPSAGDRGAPSPPPLAALPRTGSPSLTRAPGAP